MNDRTASCPYCGTRHFWKRPEKQKLRKDGEVRIECGNCGEPYRIVMNADGIGMHIRAGRKEER